jgi:hypothetical protein
MVREKREKGTGLQAAQKEMKSRAGHSSMFLKYQLLERQR